MRRGKLIRAFTVGTMLLLLMGVIAACTNAGPEPGNTGEEDGVYKLRFSTWHPPGGRDVETVWKPMIDKIEENSKGKIEVDGYFGEVLGASIEHFDIVADGISDFGLFTATFEPGRFPLSDVLSMPVEVLGKDIAADIGYEMYEQILHKDFPKNVEILQLNGCVSAMVWTVKPAKSLADLKGLRIRTPGSLQTPIIQAMGAIPVQMPLSDVYLALETGDVDGILTCPQLYQGYSLYEVAKYGLRGEFGCITEGVAMNKQTHDELPQDVRSTLKDIVRNQFRATGGLTEKAIHDCIKEIENKGVEINYLPDKDDEVLLERFANDVVKQWVEKLENEGLPAKEALLRFKAIVDKTEGAAFRSFPKEWESEVEAYR